MNPFTIREITVLRLMLRPPATRMMQICECFTYSHTRDEIVEAIDAIRRCQHDAQAATRVNQVLAMQEVGEPLINGMPQHQVAKLSPLGTIFRPHAPMF